MNTCESTVPDSGDAVTNYFKITNAKSFIKERFVFFDDSQLEETDAAFARAQATQRAHGGNLSIYQPPRARAMWPGVSIIGDRR